MSQINDGTSPPENAPDPIAQLKGETSRKLENVDAKLQALQQTNALLLEKLTQMAPPPPAKKTEADSEDLTALMYSDPAKYHAIIEERAATKAEHRIGEKLNRQQTEQARTNAVLAELTSEYPEIQDTTSELSKKTLELYSKLSEPERNNVSAWKLTVKEAAMELGMKPKSKRPVDDDAGFVGPSSGNPSRRRQQSNKLSPETEQWAQLLGVDIEDPVVRDRIVQRAQRDFTKWQKPMSTKKGKK